MGPQESKKEGEMKRSRLIRAIVALEFTTFVLAPAVVRAHTIHVDESGAGDYTTIQEGLNAAGTGDTVLVAPGTYDQPLDRALDFDGEGIVLMSQAGPGATFIDCEGEDRAFYFHNDEDSTAVVDGFSIREGDALSGGAVYMSWCSPTIKNCIFEWNSANSEGGAILCLNADSPRITDCDFLHNEGGSGGAINCYRSTAIIEGCEFIDNHAVTMGGAIMLNECTTPQITGCSFEDNTAEVAGGGIACQDVSDGLLADLTFDANGCDSEGGGLFCARSSPTIADVVFTGNSCGSRGGGIVCKLWSDPELTNVTFIDNSATYGGGMRIEDSDPTLDNVTFCRNGGSLGGGVHCVNASAPILTNVIIAFSTAGEGIACSGACDPTVSHSCIFGNAGGDSLCAGSRNNLFVDPRFCNMMEGDVTLCANSCCLPASPDNPWGELIGAHGQGCGECDSPTEAMGWGRIKAFHR
jgi:predicted outer membrane repeat protein